MRIRARWSALPWLTSSCRIELVQRLYPSLSRRQASTSHHFALRHPSTAHPDRPVSLPGYGQPVPATHPHLLAEGELTPGIQADEYEHRRRRLMAGLEDRAVVIVAGERLKYMSGNIFYKFRQATNFWYLTGWEEPDSVLVLEKNSTSKGYKMTLFSPAKDEKDEMWNGPRSGSEGATSIFGADEAADIDFLGSRLKALLQSSHQDAPIYVDAPGIEISSRTSGITTRPRSSSIQNLYSYLVPGSAAHRDNDAVAAILAGEKSRKIKSAATKIENLRLIKSEAELAVMRKAADISADAHTKVMRFAHSSLTESDLVAHFQYHCALRGASRPAYVPVCASGSSALTIHYTSNRLPLGSNDLVVLDAGCEYSGYASDVTRTFPVSGSFSTAQKHLYEALLRVQRACVDMCTVRHGMSLEDLHRKSAELLRAELLDLGFNLRGNEMERTLYPHFLGHPLGIDLHDCNGFPRETPIRENMVITVEPGISVPAQSNFPKGFHNLSVRIEDEVHVRAEDSVILSVNAPKSVVDVEAVCQGLLDGVQKSQ